MRKVYKVVRLDNTMKPYIILMLSLLFIGSVSAFSVTKEYQGLAQDVYNINDELVSSANCELGEKEVLVLTEVFADQDDQRYFEFSFFLPGTAPYDYGRSVEYGQHKVFVYTDQVGLTVNGESAGPNDVWDSTSFWTNGNIGGGRRKELIKSGNNDIIIATVSDIPIKVGDLVARVEATSCSDEAWERAGTPLIGERSSDCTYGVSQEIPDETGTLFICNDKPIQDTEVPEFSTWIMIILGVACLGFVAQRR